MNEAIKELFKSFDEETMQKIEQAVGETKLIIDDGSLVPKSDYIPRAVYNEDKKKLQQQLDERTNDLTTLQKKIEEEGNGSEKLAQELTGLKSKYEEQDQAHKKETEMLLKKHHAELALIKNNAKHPELLMKQIDFDKVSIDGENLIGLDEQIKRFKEELYKDQFGDTILNSEQTEESDNGIGELKWDEMSMLDRVKLSKEKPEVYAKLRQQNMRVLE